MSQKISSARGVLCGFADLFEQPAALGAAWTIVGKKAGGAKPQGGSGAFKILKVKSPTLNLKTSYAPAAGSPQGKGLLKSSAQLLLSQTKRTGDAGQNALAISQKLASSLKAYDREASAGKHRPLVKIHGDTILGAAHMTPRQAMAAARQAQAAGHHAAVVAKARVAVAKVAAAGKAASAAAGKAATLKPGKATILGADAAGLNPGDPGYDPTSDPNSSQYVNPSAGDGAQPSGPSIAPPTWDRQSGKVTDGAGQVQYPGYAEAGDFPSGFSMSTTVRDYYTKNGSLQMPDTINAPPKGGLPNGPVAFDPLKVPGVVFIPDRDVPLSKDDALQPFDHVPPGGVIAGDSDQGSASGWPEKSVGSWSFFYGPQYGGGGQGGQFGVAVRKFQSGDIGSHSHSGWTRHYGVVFGGGLNVDDLGPSDMDAYNTALADNGIIAPTQYPTVPFIGNPDDPQFKNLQWATVDHKWFWQAQHAPSSRMAQADAAQLAANRKAISDARGIAEGLAQAQIDLIKKGAVANAADIYGALMQTAKDEAAAAEASAKADADAALQAKTDTAATAHAQAQADAADIAAQQEQRAQAAQLDLDERKQALAERQAQAQADADAAAQAQADAAATQDQGYAPDQGYQPPPPDYSAPAPDYSAPPPVDYGDQGGDYAVPDPNNPGYLTDGSPDPGWNGGADDAATAAGQPQGGGGEADSALEAAAIDSGRGDDSGDALIGSDGEAPIDGAGRVIGIDQWGNSID